MQMKEILIRLLVAAFITFAAFALSSSARGQQPKHIDQEPQQQSASAHSQLPPETEASAVTEVLSGDADQTQDALFFTGQIAQAKGSLVLMDLITRITYQLDDQERAKPFAGRQVRVVGKLEMRSNTILVETISVRR